VIANLKLINTYVSGGHFLGDFLSKFVDKYAFLISPLFLPRSEFLKAATTKILPSSDI